jgi:hypothetical protein
MTITLNPIIISCFDPCVFVFITVPLFILLIYGKRGEKLQENGGITVSAPKIGTAVPPVSARKRFFSGSLSFLLTWFILQANKHSKEVIVGIRFLGILAALAWQCCAIEIKVDTVFTTNHWNPNARFTIKNPSAVNIVFIDSVSIRNLSTTGMFCTQIEFLDSKNQRAIFSWPVGYKNDTSYASKLSYQIRIAPLDSLVLTNAVVGNCLGCVGILAGGYSTDQCILKATFLPNSGARDSVVFIGPPITDEIKMMPHSKMSSLGKEISPVKLYDLSGRNIDIKSSRKPGVYIATYGRQADFSKKVLVSE